MAKDRAYDSRRVPNLERQERMESKFGADLVYAKPDTHDAEAEEYERKMSGQKEFESNRPEHWHETPETQDEMARHYSKGK